MRKMGKKWMAAVLSMGLLWTAVPLQTAQAASSDQTVDIDISSTSFKFDAAKLSEIEYILTNDKKNVTVQLNFESATSKAVQDIGTIAVPKSTLQAIEKSGKKATFEIYSKDGKEYAWEFTNGKMDKPADINLALKMTSVSTITLSDPITVNSAVLQMKYTSELPKNTSLILPVDKGDDTKVTYPVFYDLDNAQKNSFYLYKLSGSKLSYVTGSRFKLNDDDEFKISVATGGSYVFTPTNLGLSNPSSNTSSGTTDSVQLSSYTGTVGIGGTASIFIQRPTSGTFTVTSGNPSVAQVLGSGTAVNGGTQYQVQGLSAGISVFTVKSSNGTTTSYTLTVTSGSTPTPTPSNRGWVMIDTVSYQFAPGNIYDYKVTLSGASADEVKTTSSRAHIASVKELRRVARSDGQVDVYYRITALRASADPTTVISSVRGVHSSIRVMVTAGVKQNGVAARNQSFFTS